MLTKGLHTSAFQRRRWSIGMFFLWVFNTFVQFQPGVDFTQPFTILLNTDSAYYQT